MVGGGGPTAKPVGADATRIVYVTGAGGSYHLGDCNLLGRDRKATTVYEAKLLGHAPCPYCNP